MIEVLIASALLGIAVVGGLETFQSTGAVSSRAATLAWGQCLARGEAQAVLAAPTTAAYAHPAGVVVATSIWPAGVQTVQRVTVSVQDPRTGDGLYEVSVLKVPQLSGRTSIDTSALTRQCPRP